MMVFDFNQVGRIDQWCKSMESDDWFTYGVRIWNSGPSKGPVITASCGWVKHLPTRDSKIKNGIFLTTFSFFIYLSFGMLPRSRITLAALPTV